MAMKIGLVCLLLAIGARAQCGGGGSWYGSPSVEDSTPSFEEEESDEYPVYAAQQRSMRSSRYSPPHGYGNDLYSGGVDWEPYTSVRKSRYEGPKSHRRKYAGGHGKSKRTDYSYKGTLDGNGYERKKTSRAATYTGEEGPYRKPEGLTFKVLPPKPKCAHNLLIGCTPTVTRVPCTASAPYEAHGHPAVSPYYPPAPIYHSAPHPAPGPHYPEPYGHAAGYYYPPPSAAPPPPHVPHHQKPASPGYEAPAAEGAHGYGPSYKVANPEEIPGFAAPVREDLSESTKVPIISAFSKASEKHPGTAPAGVNGTSPEGSGSSSTTVNPGVPVLTTTTDGNKDNEEFWSGEVNTESSTNAVEGSAGR